MNISVVVPTYNRAHLLPATLDAVLAQTNKPAEIIVVNDGSTDHTLDVLAAYTPKVSVISVDNGGDIAARNIGIREATGNLVAFCDSDDLWQPGFLASMCSLWSSAPRLVSAYGNFRLFRDGVLQDRTKFDEAPAGFWEDLIPLGKDAGMFNRPIVEKLLDFQPFFPSTMAVAREPFLALGGWDEKASRIVGCDFATALRAAEHPLGVIKPALVHIRRHVGNISADGQAMNLGDAKILEILLASRPSLAPYRGLVQENIAERRRQAAAMAFDRRDFVAVRAIEALLRHEYLPAKLRIKMLIGRLAGQREKVPV